MSFHTRQGKPLTSNHLMAGQPDHNAGDRTNIIQGYDSLNKTNKNISVDSQGVLSTSDSVANALLDDINTVLNTELLTSDTIAHTKLTTIDGTLSDIDDRVAEINTTLSGTLTTTDATTHTNLGTINTTLSGTLDVCPVLCRPLLVATIFNTSSGTTAVNVLDGALKLVGFSYAHSDSQGCLSFYDVAAASTAPTSASTALFSVAATTANLSSPSFPTSSYINFENGLWIRLNGNIDPGNTTNEAGTITLYYER